jgi:isopentenyl phosphate kinase
MKELVFVKLGGSVITDKTRPETVRPEVISRLAREMAAALVARSKVLRSTEDELHMVVGHGSGSFGHVAAQRHGTRHGVRGTEGWHGFAEVAAAAARLNRTVTDSLLEAGVPVWSFQPSASALCRGGRLVSLETAPIIRALAEGLVPLLYGDVALDENQGGTIISTEQILAYLAHRLHPARLILIGEVDGVFEGDPLLEPSVDRVPVISAENWQSVRSRLGGSHAIDVTGGMLAKVEEMVELARELQGLTVHILSGERAGALEEALLLPSEAASGTIIRW